MLPKTLLLPCSHSYSACPYEPFNVPLNAEFYPPSSPPSFRYHLSWEAESSQTWIFRKQSSCRCGDEVLSPLPDFKQFVPSVLHILQVFCKPLLQGKRALISAEGKLSKALTPYSIQQWGELDSTLLGSTSLVPTQLVCPNPVPISPDPLHQGPFLNTKLSPLHWVS